MNITIFLQARMSSTRLPGKVLKKIQNKPLLELQIERVRRVQHAHRLVVLTSFQSDDDPIESWCHEHQVDCFRGNLNNVLDRFYQAACTFPSDHFVRLTGDCPLSCPEVIDQVISAHLSSGATYTSNVAPPTFPDGVDVEVFTSQSLTEAWRYATLDSDLEHVTPYIRREMSDQCHNVTHQPDWSKYRITVDYPEDFKLVQTLFDHLYPANSLFGLNEIVDYLQSHPELIEINRSRMNPLLISTP